MGGNQESRWEWEWSGLVWSFYGGWERVSSSNWLCLHADNSVQPETPTSRSVSPHRKPLLWQPRFQTHLRPTIEVPVPCAAVGAILLLFLLVTTNWRLGPRSLLVIRACFPFFFSFPADWGVRIFPERHRPQRLSWQFLLLPLGCQSSGIVESGSAHRHRLNGCNVPSTFVCGSVAKALANAGRRCAISNLERLKLRPTIGFGFGFGFRTQEPSPSSRLQFLIHSSPSKDHYHTSL